MVDPKIAIAAVHSAGEMKLATRPVVAYSQNTSP